MRYTVATGIISCLFLSSHVAAEEPRQKWQGHVEAEGRWGTQRSLGEAGLFIPVWQDEDTLLSADIRHRIDDANSQEGNYGLSLRQLLPDDGVILGGYAFFDRRRTPNANVFHQLTLGAEALWADYEARLNLYIPENNVKQLTPVTSRAVIVGSNIQVENFSGDRERALPGFDAELGKKFDLSQEWKLWLYGGGFYFNHSGFDTVAGPRARLEITRSNLPGLGNDAQLTLGVEAQHDKVRDEQLFAIARLRIPFSAAGSGRGSAQKLTALEQRMTSRIYRDVDIVSAEKETELLNKESGLVALANGEQVSNFTLVDANGDLAAALTAAGANSLVVADGDAGIINTNNAQLQQGQTLISGGTRLNVRTASGKSLPVTLPGSRATVHGISDAYVNDTDLDVTLLMADASSVKHLDVTGGHYAILNRNVENVTFEDLNIENSIGFFGGGAYAENVHINITTGFNYGIYASNLTGTLELVNSSINAAGYTSIWVEDGAAILNNVDITNSDDYGLVAFDSQLEMNNTTFHNAGATAVWLGDNVLSGSGNVISGAVGEACRDVGGNTGSLAFDDILGGGAATCH